MNLKEAREWINLVLTVIGVCAIGYLNLRFANQKLEIEKDAQASYVTKPEFTATITALNDGQAKQWEALRQVRDKQSADKSDTDLRLQHISDVVTSRRGDGVPRSQSNN